MTKERRKQDTFLKCLLEANVDGIIAFDMDCRYTLWNRAMEEFSGVKREEVLGRSAFELFDSLKETGEDKYYLAAIAGKTVVAEARPYNIPETGRSGFFDGYYSPRHDENGSVIGGVAIIRDVTDRKRRAASDPAAPVSIAAVGMQHLPHLDCILWRILESAHTDQVVA